MATDIDAQAVSTNQKFRFVPLNTHNAKLNKVDYKTEQSDWWNGCEYAWIWDTPTCGIFSAKFHSQYGEKHAAMQRNI